MSLKVAATVMMLVMTTKITVQVAHLGHMIC